MLGAASAKKSSEYQQLLPVGAGPGDAGKGGGAAWAREQTKSLHGLVVQRVSAKPTFF